MSNQNDNKIKLTLDAVKNGQVVETNSISEEEARKALTEYVDTMINGTPLAQISTYKSLGSFAQKALEELQKNNFKNKQEQLSALIEQVKKLVEMKEQLETLIGQLKQEEEQTSDKVAQLKLKRKEEEQGLTKAEQEKKVLEEKINSLKADGINQVNREIDALRNQKMAEIRKYESELDTLKNNGMNQVDLEIQEYRERRKAQLDEEIQALRKDFTRKLELEIERIRKEKEASLLTLSDKVKSYTDEIIVLEKREKELNGLIEELKGKYNETIRSIEDILNRKNDITVSWNKISKDNPLYSANNETIASYIATLKKSYMEALSVSKEKVDSDFAIHAPGLMLLQSIIAPYSKKESIREIINSNTTSAKSLSTIMASIELPVYQNRVDYNLAQGKIDISNTSLMSREIRLQQMALEAIAKQRIAEEQLDQALKILLPLIPDSINLEEVLGNASTIESGMILAKRNELKNK